MSEVHSTTANDPTRLHALPSPTPRVVGAGAAGLVIAGAMQLLAGLPLISSGSGPGPAAWQLICWTTGGAVLLLASVVLANSRPGAVGIAGSSVVGRIALIGFGADGLLSLGIDRLALATGAAVTTALTVGFCAVRFLGATTVTAVVLAREATLSGFAKWTFALVVLSDAISVVLLLALPNPTGFIVSAYTARPACLVVVGASLLLHPRATAAPHKTRM